MRQEVRRLIESRLELKDGASDIREVLKIVDECQDEAFNRYRILSGFDFHNDEGVYTTSDPTPTTQVPQPIPCDPQTLTWSDVSGLQPDDETTTPHMFICGSSAVGSETWRNSLVKEEHFPDGEASMVDWSDWLASDNDQCVSFSKTLLY